jgi:DNA-binding transcriptional LysR family regulator
MHAAVLHYLKEAARRGSIRKAADDALDLASSEINRQTSKLEVDLGVRVFDRKLDGICLTSAGEVLLRHFRATLQQKSLSLVPFIDNAYACSVAPCGHASSPTRSRC